MVEDMYKEEFGETEMDSNSSSDNATKFRDELPTNDAQEDQPDSSTDKYHAKQSSHEQPGNELKCRVLPLASRMSYRAIDRKAQRTLLFSKMPSAIPTRI
ncbi:hypothetical protein KSP40_PGU019308 [Platanthera guangdongensis]|uniref:Uncharacterized protein n=1 Tax=Platanthera guangdongensis TaxID=2320717 RepID=A0ABR2MVQ5_9ASPA